MAKNLNSASFTLLLLVLAMASTEFLKTEALPGVECPPGSGCLDPAKRVFLGECGDEPFLGTDLDCCECCKKTFPIPPLCWAVVEGSDLHCHCYQKKV
ncbi:defensin-like protein 206 [Eutrema salsugineum]|uniref:defensin-like protein 206 n=1 Tax=Eutrema salsugineum TaxID=72664 RepID=UPI000CED0406|nr:defensin-like protein 206 [Eutrema salsugineum]